MPEAILQTKEFNIQDYLRDFVLAERERNSFDRARPTTAVEYGEINGNQYPKFINEFWTSRQRQASPLHEIAYRACFKPQLPRFFIEVLTGQGDAVYDPFSGRATTALEAGLLGRNVVSNDVNPLSQILTYSRFFVPILSEIESRLNQIPFDKKANAKADLSMFYHPRTETELVSLKDYLQERKENQKEDRLDSWIRMVATNRLSGHSPGFFSVYTLPPNQAVSPENQVRINEKRRQAPEYRDVRKLILRKTKSLIGGIRSETIERLLECGERAVFLTKDARNTLDIRSESIRLTVTSPPFLNVVQYAKDNWLRCWFNAVNTDDVSKKITMSKSLEDWTAVMQHVFDELYRVTKPEGWVAFEVGEVRSGKLKLDEYVVPLGTTAGFSCEGIMINQQKFTKTANIWGIDNNRKGTNSNRIVIFRK